MSTSDSTIQEGLLTTSEAEILLRLKPHTLRQWRVQGKGPSYIKSGRFVRYSKADLELWADQHRKDSGD